jgi:hypothetical protein
MSKWLFTTVWAPTTATEGESFLWYRVDRKLQLGVAYLWKQSAFRALGNYEVIAERQRTPNLRVGFGVQGIGTGNPGYFATSEKTLMMPEGRANVYLGVGFRANENHGHLLGGLKFSPKGGPYTLGIQNDGHTSHPFVNRYFGGGFSAGLYLIGMKTPGIMVSYARN